MSNARLASLIVALATTSATVARADDAPQLAFEERPAYLGRRQVALTFNDGPGWNSATSDVLDVLAGRQVQATFFVNTGPETTDWSQGQARQIVQRIVDDGHLIGSHGRSHRHLPGLDEASLRREIFGVEDDLATLGIYRRISLFRAAYGEPYQAHYQRTALGWDVSDAGYDRIAPVAAESLVHIGWNIDSGDWRCPSGPEGASCVFDNIRAQLEQGRYGIILLHSIDRRTAPALEMLLDYLEANGYRVVPVERAVCNKYRATSANLIDGVRRCDPALR